VSPTPTYEDVYRRSSEDQPFANGTEYDEWVRGWCLRLGAYCQHDQQMRTGEGLCCPLLDVMLLTNRTPAELGERQSALGRGMYQCSMYEPET
jgi:hypothetical protein